MSDISEADIQRQILDYLAWRGILAKRCNTGKVRIGKRTISLGPEGWPDIIGVLPDGRFLGIEVKRADGRMRVAQREWFKRCPSGACIFVARNIDDVQEALK